MTKNNNKPKTRTRAASRLATTATAVGQRTCSSPERFFDEVPGLFFTLRRDADGRMFMPFVAGCIVSLPGLSHEALAEDIEPMLALCRRSDAAWLLAELNRSAEGMTPCRVELRIVGAAGGPAVMEFKASPRRDDDRPGVVEWHGFIHDITAAGAVAAAQDDKGAFLESLLDTIPIPVFFKDRGGRYLGFNKAFEVLTGRRKAHQVGKTAFDLHPHQLAEEYRAQDEAIFARGGMQQYECRVSDAQGEIREVVCTKAVLKDGQGAPAGLIGAIQDVTERKRAEAELQDRYEQILELNERLEEIARSVEEHAVELEASQEQLRITEAWYRGVLHSAPDGMVVTNDRGIITLVNAQLARMFGYAEHELIGQSIEVLVPSKVRSAHASAREAFTARMGEDAPARFGGDLRGRRKDGSEIPVDIVVSRLPYSDECSGTVCAAIRDITELSDYRQKLHRMAFYDPLTALPNRALFNDRLRQMITDAKWHGQMAGVMLIDMDRFKAVNDTMGHAVGDELLREAAVRLVECVRAYDTVARFGGDEFAILLPEIRNADDLGRIADKVLSRFHERFLLDGREVFVSCSIGIALYPNDSNDADDLVKYADSAMYFAKRSGRNSFRFYSKDLTASARERLTLESELRRAVERDELELHYQPKVLLDDGTMIGSEALLRWRHPRLGMVPPGQFIQIAEDTGLIVELGQWVLREACRAAAEWNSPGMPLHKVAINLSARQFDAQDLAGTVARILEETGCHAEWIELEITESLLLDEDGRTLETLTTFRSMGISIAIDDFGTGYSALSYLARFPIDTIKIDRSFISRVTTENYGAELVKAILSIARCLGHEVVAEGVETIQQSAFLAAHGCRIAQGFLYSKPLPKAEIESLVRRQGVGDLDREGAESMA